MIPLGPNPFSQNAEALSLWVGISVCIHTSLVLSLTILVFLDSSLRANPRLGLVPGDAVAPRKHLKVSETGGLSPSTTAMDSEDEFMSGISDSPDEDFGAQQDSDDGSLEDGKAPRAPANVTKRSLFLDFDDEDEPDLGFSQDKEIMRPKKKSYEVDFTVCSPSDIQAHQDSQVEEVSAILGQPTEASAILLRHLRWNKERLIEAYMDRPEVILENAGLGSGSQQASATKILQGFTGSICCEDEAGMETYALKCNHRYCVNCYRQYLAQKIKEEGEAARIQCPTEGCHRIVDSKSMDLLVAAELRSRYDRTRLKRSLGLIQRLGIRHS